MTHLRGPTLGLAAIIATLLVGCADRTLPLSPGEEEALSRGGRNAGGEVQALRWVENDRGATDRAVITVDEGGTLEANGVTLRFPAGSVSEDVAVTMTVPPGGYMIASLQPHGLEFEQATLTFDVSGSEDPAGPFTAFYVETQSGRGQGVFQPRERFEVTVGPAGASFDITHFSGYIVASGRY